MNRPFKAAIVGLLLTTTLVLALWIASQGWEKAFATRVSVEISPNRCYRLEEFRPYWLVPDGFHPRFRQDELWNPITDWYGPWFPNEHPRFYRLFDNRTGEMLAESAVYDMSMNAGAGIIWPSEWIHSMHAGYTRLAENLPPCRRVVAGTSP